jgi:hypothetical protein
MERMNILKIGVLIGVQAVFSQSLDSLSIDSLSMDSLSIDNIISAADSVRQDQPQQEQPAHEPPVDSIKVDAFAIYRQDSTDTIKKRLLAKDTTNQGYKNRIEYVRGFVDSLTGEQQIKFQRTIEVLKDYIVESEAKIVKETPKTAQIKLGLYDKETELYQVIVQDTANAVSPFLFAGRLNVPDSLAVAMDSNATGLSVNVWRLSNPFQGDSQSVNLAFVKLAAYRDNVSFAADGNFHYLPRYKSMPGFAEWKQRNDSLLNGTLRPRGYDLNYALTGVVPEKEEKSSWGWFGWAKFLAMGAAVICGSLSGYEHFAARDEVRAMDILNDNKPPENARRASDGADLNLIWQNKYDNHADNRKNIENRRDRFRNAGIGLGVLGVTMIVFDYAF